MATTSRVVMWEKVKPLSFARVGWSVFYRPVNDGKVSEGRSLVVGCPSITAITVEPAASFV